MEKKDLYPSDAEIQAARVRASYILGSERKFHEKYIIASPEEAAIAKSAVDNALDILINEMGDFVTVDSYGLCWLDKDYWQVLKKLIE